MLRYISLFTLISFVASAQMPSYNPMDIQQALQQFNTIGTVLYIAAHPDDENTRLLTYLAREKHLRTCYLSLNRGEGGQNLIGKEQGALLGIIRSQECMQARSVDGAEQYFTRVIDFGYSKSPDETFKIWNHDSVLADVVYLIRKLQPDVIITRFPTTGEGGHGHHTASAILAGEAFKISGNPSYFPSQLSEVKPWQAKSLYWNTFNFGSNNTQREDQIKLDVGLFNSITGKSCNEIAALSRSQHKSQGFGVSVSRGSTIEYFKNIDGDTSCTTLFCNNNFSWRRLRGTENIQALCNKAISTFDYQNPENLLPLLFQIRAEIEKLNDPYWRTQKLKELNRIIIACSGFWAEAITDNYFSSPGDSVTIKLNLIKYQKPDITLAAMSIPNYVSLDTTLLLEKNKFYTIEKKITIAQHTPYSYPYWLMQTPESARYRIESYQQINQPVNEAALTIAVKIKVDDQMVDINLPVKYKWADPVEGEKYRPYNIVPPVSINFSDPICMMPDGQQKELKITVRGLSQKINGTLKLNAPKGFIVSPSSFIINDIHKNERQVFTATIRLISEKNIPDPGLIKATFVSPNTSSGYSLQELSYNHIPYQMYFTPAEAKVVPFQCVQTKKAIGYIEGAGDDMVPCLQQLGYTVTILKEEDIKNSDLNAYHTIVAGVRAYNTNEWMSGYKQKFLDYISNGGNYIVQYNTNNNIGKLNENLGPYPFKISRNRVTDENAEIKINNPEHEVFNYPNKIQNQDFSHWIQERGIYFATDIDSAYSTPISCHDDGEKDLNGGLIIANYGKGHFVYTGLAFFRQLPAGIPGAYRFFTNLMELPNKR
jgi:LmbE family N-acetylglucosaminyl deacetylase